MHIDHPISFKKFLSLLFLFSLIFTMSCSGDGSADEPPCNCSIDCTENCNSSLLTNLTIEVNGTDRSYDVFLPSAYEFSSQLPVIIDLHGFTSSASEQRSISNFIDLADDNTILMVWPQALETGTSCVFEGVSGKYWNADWGAETNDVNFIDQLIDQLILDYDIDPKRVYVTGISNGGFMTYSIACELSNRIAAVASVAGSMTQNILNTSCNPARQLPVMHIHGTNDAVVLWEGQESCLGGIAPIEEVVAFWRINAECSETFNEITYKNTNNSDGSTVSKRTYDNCGDKIQFVIVEGGGHNWPGSQYQINQGFSVLLPINQDIAANDVIWEFFKQHELP